MKLTSKQRKFCDLYIETGNATQSYIDAGYKATTREVAHANSKQLLQNHSVKKFMQEYTDKLNKDKIAQHDEILSFLTQVVRGEITEETPVTMKETFEVFNKHPSVKDRIKAAEQIGKRYAMWTEKSQVENITPTFKEDVPEDD